MILTSRMSILNSYHLAYGGLRIPCPQSAWFKRVGSAADLSKPTASWLTCMVGLGVVRKIPDLSRD